VHRSRGPEPDPCEVAELVLANGSAVPLRHRITPARVVDFIQFCSIHELPELHLRLAEMAHLVDEIHIAEADRTWTGVSKEFVIPDLLQKDPLVAKWKDKIVHHPVHVPQGAYGYEVQSAAIMTKDKIPKDGGGLLLEADLDEVVSRPVLKAIRNCVPQGFDEWDAYIDMDTYKYNMGWTSGRWKWPPIVWSTTSATSSQRCCKSKDACFCSKTPETALCAQAVQLLQNRAT